MKKTLLFMTFLAITSSSFAGSVGQVEGKMEDCAKLNNSGVSSLTVAEPDTQVLPEVIETTNNI